MPESPVIFDEMVKGIVFDLDGTLADSLHTTLEGFNHAILALGGRKHSPQEIMAHFGMGEGPIFAKLIGPDKADEAYELCKQFTDENLGNVPLFEGVAELLRDLRAAGIPSSIFTGRSWDTTEMILKHHGLMNEFVTVVCHDHVSSSKPSPEGLQLCLARMKLDPAHALYVGDSWQDMAAARRAGVKGAAALWDLLVDRKRIETENPAYWVERPQDLRPLIPGLR